MSYLLGVALLLVLLGYKKTVHQTSTTLTLTGVEVNKAGDVETGYFTASDPTASGNFHWH